jgi:hypothetical protein
MPMMFDLTDTPFAQSTSRDTLPSEDELVALTVALVLVTWFASGDLAERALSLSPGNVEAVSRLLEGPLLALGRDLGRGPDSRGRLRQFIGLRVRLGTACNPIFS